jgi:hypothetical protein
MEQKTFVIQPPQNCVPPPEKPEWDISTLAQKLVNEKIIPVSIVSDATLYSLLIVQMELQLVRNLVVPYGVQTGNLLRNVNAKAGITGRIYENKNNLRTQLEKETGVNINYWYKIEVVKKKRKNETKENTKRGEYFLLKHNMTNCS